jgi:hypothetical protein
MNFIEAVNSGKRFRTTNMENSWFVLSDGFLEQQHDGEGLLCNKLEIDKSIINSMFEVEDKTITITESELDKAYSKHANTSFNGYKCFKKELGF